MKTPARLAVFVSGGGTNLQALLDHFNGRDSPMARVELVVANRATAGGLDRAQRAGVETRVIDPSIDADPSPEQVLAGALESHGIDVIVLAGYLKLVPLSVVRRYQGAMVNIHPALLPAFGGPGMYGLRVHEAVIASGTRVTGATVHLVDDRYDEGRIIAQWPVPVFAEDTPVSLAERVLRVEHLLLPAAIEGLIAGSIRGEPNTSEAFELVDDAAPKESSVRRLAI